MAKYDFYKVYQGPRGAHLNHLTKNTLTKELRTTGSAKPRKLAEGRSVQGRDANPAG
jgi:hypothetical protein